MEPATKSLEAIEGDMQHTAPLVFLDSSVIVGYLRGDATAVQLFSAEAMGQIRLAVNAIVLQELLLVADAATSPKFEHMRDHLRILPVDYKKAEGLLEKARDLRNCISHSNDILIFDSADDCDFLVTRDTAMKKLTTTDRPQVVTPEELITQLRAA
jgi:predicted nucleic acid-binding protein